MSALRLAGHTRGGLEGSSFPKRANVPHPDRLTRATVRSNARVKCCKVLAFPEFGGLGGVQALTLRVGFDGGVTVLDLSAGDLQGRRGFPKRRVLGVDHMPEVLDVEARKEGDHERRG